MVGGLLVALFLQQPAQGPFSGASLGASVSPATVQFDLTAYAAFHVAGPFFVGPRISAGRSLSEVACGDGGRRCAFYPDLHSFTSLGATMWWRREWFGVSASVGGRVAHTFGVSEESFLYGLDTSAGLHGYFGVFEVSVEGRLAALMAPFMAFDPSVRASIGVAIDRKLERFVPGIGASAFVLVNPNDCHPVFTTQCGSGAAVMLSLDVSASIRLGDSVELRPFVRAYVPVVKTGFDEIWAGGGPGLSVTKWFGWYGLGGAANGVLLVRADPASLTFGGEAVVTPIRARWANGTQDAALDLGVLVMTRERYAALRPRELVRVAWTARF